MPDYVPAIKGKMGDWQYYVTVMKLGKIARECKLAEEIHSNRDLDELIQRKLQARVQQEMVPYLLNEPQRFYGALVVAVYGGDPEFSEVKVSEHRLLDDNDADSSYGFGLLRFDGSQIYYALDGQHRLKSIQEAISIDADLAKEDITVIVLKHEETKDGLERTRRLFSTLNRRAKPTSRGVNIAIDEDDSIAIITRRLVKENDLLKNLVSIKLGSKSLPPTKSNDPYLTTLTTLYEVNENLIGGFKGGKDIDAGFKQFRPASHVLEEYYSFVQHSWTVMIEHCPKLELVLNGAKNPGDLRKEMDSEEHVMTDENNKPIVGGLAFARPLGQLIVSDVLKTVGQKGKNMDEAIKAIMGGIPMTIADAPWANVIWNPTAHKIMSGGSNRKLVGNLIRHALGLPSQLKATELKQQYRDMVGDPKAPLLPPVNWSGRSQNATDGKSEP